jgi:restriction system protein
MGGSASISELYERVIADMKLDKDILAIAHGDGTTTEVEYRLAWARTYLKKVGAIHNSERGIWALTAEGRKFTEKDAANVVRQVRQGIPSTSSSNTDSGDLVENGINPGETNEITVIAQAL